MSHQDTITWFKKRKRIPGDINDAKLWPPWTDSIAKREDFLVQVVHDIVKSCWRPLSPKKVKEELEQADWNYMATLISILWG